MEDGKSHHFPFQWVPVRKLKLSSLVKKKIKSTSRKQWRNVNKYKKYVHHYPIVSISIPNKEKHNNGFIKQRKKLNLTHSVFFFLIRRHLMRTMVPTHTEIKRNFCGFLGVCSSENSPRHLGAQMYSDGIFFVYMTMSCLILQ